MYHITFIVNGSSWSVYSNGNALKTTSCGSYTANTTTIQSLPYNVGYTIASNYDNVCWGGATNGGAKGPCYLDDFRVYKRVLTATEITTIYNYR